MRFYRAMVIRRRVRFLMQIRFSMQIRSHTVTDWACAVRPRTCCSAVQSEARDVTHDIKGLFTSHDDLSACGLSINARSLATLHHQKHSCMLSASSSILLLDCRYKQHIHTHALSTQITKI